MIERLERSWNLTLQCLAVLREDKSLMLFPLFSGLALILIAASFAVPLWPLAHQLAPSGGRAPDHTLAFILVFLFYFVQFSVMNFFNTALVEVALQRFDGKPATVGDGLRRACVRLPVILVYSAVAATVGTVLRMLEERVGIIGRIVIALVGVVWAVATALVVPVIAAEDVGPFEAITRSGELIRKAWGEEIIGNAGIGLVFGIVIALVVIGGGLALTFAFTASASLGIALFAALILAVCFVALAQTTLQGIYAAALYRYADGDAATGVDAALLGDAFRVRT